MRAEVRGGAKPPKAKREGRSTKPSKAEESRAGRLRRVRARDKELRQGLRELRRAEVADGRPRFPRAAEGRPTTASKKKKGPNFKRPIFHPLRVAPECSVTGEQLDELAAAESETA